MNEQELSTFQRSLIEIEVLIEELIDNERTANPFPSIDLDKFGSPLLSNMGGIL